MPQSNNKKVNILFSRLQRDLKKNTEELFDRKTKNNLRKVILDFMEIYFKSALEESKNTGLGKYVENDLAKEVYVTEFVEYCREEAEYPTFSSVEMEEIVNKHLKQFAEEHYKSVS